MNSKIATKLAKWAASVEGVTLFAKREAKSVPVLSTGNAIIDAVTGIGGFPVGRFTEIFGGESSGKTTLALSCAATAQREGKGVLLVDAEHAFDPNYYTRIGGDMGNLALLQPYSAEGAFKVIREACASGVIQLVIVDSLAALTPEDELEEDTKIGLGSQARMLSYEFRRLTQPASANGVCIVFLNQVRTKPNAYGSPEYTPGGNAPRFYASMRISLRNVGQIKRSDKVVGNTIRIRVVKNKLANPFQETEVPLYHGLGFSQAAALLDRAIDENIDGVSKVRGLWKIGSKSYSNHIDAIEAFSKEKALVEAALATIAVAKQPEHIVDGDDESSLHS